jgi:hypothetical protein
MLIICASLLEHPPSLPLSPTILSPTYHPLPHLLPSPPPITSAYDIHNLETCHFNIRSSYFSRKAAFAIAEDVNVNRYCIILKGAIDKYMSPRKHRHVP